jgi:anti-sigma factor ChrR (cupin superfamily)
MTGLPQSGSVKIDAAGIPAGGDTRSLIDDPRGYRTILLKIEPSPLGELHSHTEIEQIYILEGDFFDDDESYGAGDFVLRMPGAMHRAGSRNGCTMLITYTPFVEVNP